ncbi:MAG: hypothetical protein QQN50_06695, partial [Nitrosopumilus sp.]
SDQTDKVSDQTDKVSDQTDKVSDQTDKVSDQTQSKAKSETEQIAIDAEKMKSLDTLEDEEAKFK